MLTRRRLIVAPSADGSLGSPASRAFRGRGLGEALGSPASCALRRRDRRALRRRGLGGALGSPASRAIFFKKTRVDTLRKRG